MNAKKLLTLLLAALLFLTTACSSGGDKDEGLRTYKLGVTGTDYEIWNGVNDRLKEHGIVVEIISFSDYVQPNMALAQGELDLNSFQTEIFFDDFCEAHGLDLVNVGYTSVAPMGVYSEKYTDMADVPEENIIVAIPNDVTNGGRAIKFLEVLGFVSVDPDAGLTPNKNDITGYFKGLTADNLVEMVATQIPRSLADLDIALINNGVAYEAGLLLAEDAVVSEDPNEPHMKSYWNMIAVRGEDANNPDLLKIVEVYQSDETRDHLIRKFGGQSIPVF